MATKILTFEGTVSWAKVFPENRDMYQWNDQTMKFDKPSETDGRYSVNLEMSPDDYRELKKTGSVAAKNSKISENGFDEVKFSRPHERKDRNGDVMEWASGPPKVTMDGKEYRLEDGVIGNGSKCKVTVSVYDTKYSPGTRLESIEILDLEAYADPTEAEPVPF